MWEGIKYQTGFGSEFASEDPRAPVLWFEFLIIFRLRWSQNHAKARYTGPKSNPNHFEKAPFLLAKILLKNVLMASTQSKSPEAPSQLQERRIQEHGCIACSHPPSTGDSSDFLSARISLTIGMKSFQILIRSDGCLLKCQKRKMLIL